MKLQVIPSFLIFFILVFSWDIHTQIHAQSRDIQNENIQRLERAGDVFQIILPLFALSLSIIDREAFPSFLKSYSSTYAAVLYGKYGLDSVRTPDSLENQQTLGERPNGGRHNFPSGHTASAFSGAAFVGARYGWLRAAPLLVLAILTGYSRVAARKHTPSAVFAGASIALLAARSFVPPLHGLSRTQFAYPELSFSLIFAQDFIPDLLGQQDRSRTIRGLENHGRYLLEHAAIYLTWRL